MRSMVSSAIVPCTSDIGAGAMSSTASPTRETRCGRHVQLAARAVARADEPVLPILGATRDRRRDAVGLGAARRLERDLAPPAEELAVGEVGRALDLGARPCGPARTTRSRRWCGTAARRRRRRARRARSPDRVAPTRACRRAAARRARCRCCRRVAERSSASASFAVPSRALTPRTARACMPVTMTFVDLVGRELGRLQRRVPRLLDERAVLHFAEALFPRARTGRARRAPALDELLGRARAAEVLGDDRAVGVVADEQRARAVAGGRLRRRSSAVRRACRR